MSFVHDDKTRARALRLINERRARQGLPPMPEPESVEQDADSPKTTP